jgi:hypothetical protein
VEEKSKFQQRTTPYGIKMLALKYSRLTVPACRQRASLIGFPRRLSNASTATSSTVVTSSSSSNPKSSSSTTTLAMASASALAIATLSSLAYINNHVGGISGLQRTISFYSLAIPKYIQYRMHMLLDSPDEVWDQLHEATSKNGLDKILELQGFYIKSGQMCAANIGNAFPKIWQDTMSVLQDECPAEPFEVVKGIVEGEYGKKLDQVFDSFEEVPIGAASIGQVHRATLKDGTR